MTDHSAQNPPDVRTIEDLADELNLPPYRLRSWETLYPLIHPLSGEGGQRYYTAQDVAIIRKIADLLYVQKRKSHEIMAILRAQETQRSPQNKALEEREAVIAALKAQNAALREVLQSVLAELQDLRKLLPVE